MAIFKRGKFYSYEFVFQGQRIRESTRTSSKALAERAERNRRRQLEESIHGVVKREMPKLFSVAAREWLQIKKANWSESTLRIEQKNGVDHLLPSFGKLLVIDIKSEHIFRYQHLRQSEGAANKTVNLELGTLRSILRRNKLWANLQQDVRMLPTCTEVGKALTHEQQQQLEAACMRSRSRSLHTIVVVTLNTGLRRMEVQLLKWRQVGLMGKVLTVGRSKTQNGAGRVVPLNRRAYAALQSWAAQFPQRDPEHYIFPSEKYGASGDKFEAKTYSTNPMEPLGSFKEAWEKAKKSAGLIVRFHDLRHTAVTRMLESGIPLPVVGAVMGWSAATMVRMSKIYGHFADAARREAVDAICASATAENSGVKMQPERMQ